MNSDSPSTSPEWKPETPPRVKRKYTRKAKESPGLLMPTWASPEPEPVREPITAEPDSLAVQFAAGLKLPPSFYRITKQGEREAFVITYAGLLSLCMASGELLYADARPICDKDKFALDFGQQILQHAPWDGLEGPGPLTGAWAQSIDKQGFKQISYVAARDVPARAGWTNGMTAEAIFRKVALMDLIANSPLQLTAARVAMEAERQMTA